jgi:hypothetical protein
MYTLIWLSLAAGLLIAPAVACMPRLVFSSKTAIAIPLLSSLILYLCKETLWFLSLYNTTSFRLLVALFFLVAMIRLRNQMSIQKFDWTQKEVIAYLFNFLLLLPLLIWFWITPYDTMIDSVTSWDMWAQQHYLGVRPDFFYTFYPYPQAFSVYISNIYILLGSADHHEFARSLFFIFPYCILTILSLSLVDSCRSIWTPLWFSAGMYILFFIAAFSHSCADPMMAAGVCASAFYTLLWHKEKKITHLWLSAACALLAILAKQHAVFWALMAWPALLLMTQNFYVQRRKILLLIGGVFLFSAAWFILEGEGIRTLNNQMAIGQSMADRDIFQQFFYGSSMVVMLFPLTLVLLMFVTVLSWHDKIIRVASVLFVLPALIAWIMFGAYSVNRAGIHIIAVMATISALHIERLRIFLGRFFKKININTVEQLHGSLPLKKISVFVGVAFVISFEASHFFRSYPLGEGHRNTMVKLYQIDSPELFDKFYYQNGIKMFTQNETINSIMLRRAEIARPDHGSTELDMLNLISSSGSDVLFPYPPSIDRTPLGRTLDTLAWFCPKLFSPKLTDYNLEIYSINLDQIESCREVLVTRKFFVTPDPVSLY